MHGIIKEAAAIKAARKTERRVKKSANDWSLRRLVIATRNLIVHKSGA